MDASYLLNIDDFRRWLLQRYRFSTVNRTIKAIRQLGRAVGGLEKLADLQNEVMDYVLALNLSVGTKHNLIVAYLRWLRYCDIKPNPKCYETLRTLQRLTPRRLPKVPRYETCQAAVAMARGRFKVLLALTFYAGLRLNEALNLRWAQVDLAGRRLIIEESEKKSEGSILPIPDPLHAILSTAPRKNEFVCRINERTYWKCMKRLKEKLVKQGFSDAEHLNAKNMRHVFATTAYARTKDIIYVQRLLRHRSILTTQRYIHLLVDTKHYDVRVVSVNDTETIKTLLGSGYEVALQTKNQVYLRRPQI